MGLVNGYLPDSELRTIPWQTNVRVSIHIYANVVSFGETFKARFGHYPRITSAYRTYARQVEIFAQYGYPRAEYPGNSKHGLGRAVDWASGIEDYLSPQWRFVNSTGRTFGLRPVNERNLTFEPWHWQDLVSTVSNPGFVVPNVPEVIIPTPPGGIMPILDQTDLDNIAAVARGAVLAMFREAEPQNILISAADQGSSAAGLRLWREPEIANVIAYNAERAVVSHPANATVDTNALAAAIVAALPPVTSGITPAQVQVAVKEALATLTLKSI